LEDTKRKEGEREEGRGKIPSPFRRSFFFSRLVKRRGREKKRKGGEELRGALLSIDDTQETLQTFFLAHTHTLSKRSREKREEGKVNPRKRARNILCRVLSQ